MTEDYRETIVVRDRDQLLQLADVESWDSMTLVAITSANPRNFDELRRAWLRYRPEERLEELPWTPSKGEAPAGPWVMLDLACQRVVSGNGAELPEDRAAYKRDEGRWTAENPVIWVHLPPGWEMTAGIEWSEALPPLPVPAEPLDVRGVLYGRPLAESIARRAVEIARTDRLPAQRVYWSQIGPADVPSESEREAANKFQELTIRVHADWLMTPREDLEGKPPRHFLHEGRDWLEREVDHRKRQWSHEGRAPRAVDPDTFAYRFGPMGRHEVVMYFYLCREVIQAAWDQLHEAPDMDVETLTPLLQQHAQGWLSEGSIDDDPTPPSVIIETERRHLPLLSDGSHLDCECPICQMIAEGEFGPTFVGFDGYSLELDNEFAFSLCASHEEWEMEREMYRQDGP